MDKTGIKGLSVEQIKKMEKNARPSAHHKPKTIINSKKRYIKRPNSVPGVYERITRPDNKFLTSLADKVTRIPLPEKGAFNSGLVQFPDRKEYILTYRPDEYRFIACILDENLQIKPGSYHRFRITNCADPRLIWTPDNKLLMVYSSTSEGGIRYECIRGAIIMDLNKSEEFIEAIPFRISPVCNTRHKNWMPFIYDSKIYLVASICPHIVYELKLGKEIECKQVFETTWINPWMFQEFLRGNTNCVLLDDGNYLTTFHTATWHKGRCFYDNGAYVFEGKPPFKVLKCANRTYLKAEDATEPHFRKANLIVCTFPVGMIKDGNKLLISYGDNDSCVKIMETTVEDMQSLMLDVY